MVDLSRAKVASQSSIYPCLYDACSKFYIASNAVDRDLSTCTRNKEIGILSSTHTVWWRVDLGKIYSIYSINVLFKNYDGYEMRQRGRFAGFSLYLSNSSLRMIDFLCYEDGKELPPLNFTTPCVGYGRYVTFYNQRLHEIKYPDGYESTTITELCEVIVNGCSEAGVYGENCNVACPKNCQEQRCDIVNGTCLGCLPGWSGRFCENICQGGWYGLECKLRCFGHCRNNAFCNHVTGQCDNGCAEGWKGIYSECKDGYYGLDCKFKCSSHCQNNGPCNKKTGHCDEGCEVGYTNLLCNSVCKGGYYGRNCSHKCSPKCIDTCQHTDGSCTCSYGWMGINCNQDSTDPVLPIPLIWFLGLLLSVVLNLCFVLIAGFKNFR
ncbi:multiple epidermal growth factor-like domains protein 10 [Saccostrea echinata]|uniref:multiple epidermal growth factor-like domains protein 10 n=1 Tax=Saccostrea echinata TaxID=191078 RepID=UPI002A818716|nr:multiple epidermal growth factor-like domains protein 10 [Saccostrea echinata]